MEAVECDSLDCGKMYERVRALGAVSVDGGSEVLDTVEWLDEVCTLISCLLSQWQRDCALFFR